MSLRIDTAEWIAGALLIGDDGGGVLAQSIPASGDNGPGYTYNDLALPTDNGKEICGRITTWPSAGTLTAYEDTSFTFTAPDGNYTFAYQLYVDYVAVGAPTAVSLAVGTGAVAGAIGWTEAADSFYAYGTASAPVIPGAGGAVLPVCIACIMSTRPINLQAAMSSAAINLTVSF